MDSESSLLVDQQILGHGVACVTLRYAYISVKSLDHASDNASAIIKD